MLLFDLDGTLIDSNGVWKEVDRTFLARRGLPYTHAYYQGVAHTILPLAAKFTREFCHLEESCEDIIAEWMDLAKDAYAHVELKPGDMIEIQFGTRSVKVEVVRLQDTTKKEEAAELYRYV